MRRMTTLLSLAISRKVSCDIIAREDVGEFPVHWQHPAALAQLHVPHLLC